MKKKICICLLAALMAVCLIVAVACDKKPTGDGNKEVIKGEFDWKAASGNVSVEFGNSQKVLPTDIPEKADEESVMIHYYRKSANDYLTWGFWLWTESGSVSSENEPPYGWRLTHQDDYGAVAVYSFTELGLTPGTNEKMGIIAKKLQETWVKDTEADRYIDFSAFPLDENNYHHVYMYQGDLNLYKDIDSLTHGMTAAFENEWRVSITTKTNIKYIEILEGNTIIGKAETEDTRSISFSFAEDDPDVSQIYTINAIFADDDYRSSCSVNVTALFESDMFNENYNYDGELGALYTPTATTFKVWSPVSSKIMLNIYEQGNGGSATSYEMKKGAKGVFEYKLNGNQDGKYYTYTVYNTSYPYGMEIVDPYAKSAGLNGKRGMVVNFNSSAANPNGWNDVTVHPYDANELVVWETHVADVTSSDTWGGNPEWSKKYLGMTQKGTTYTSDGKTVSTGFDHIKELGVNAVQLVPIFDQANIEQDTETAQVSFNWGYNPLNYNVLEGVYSTDPTNGYVRINEFKQLVMAYNEAGINIIMDVVYNHVNQAIASNFDVLMPGYYFRYKKTGDASNGSGCGNETASEHYMFRKFMIDSVCFWAKEYKLGGFRFDLMGLHDIETMNMLAAELKKINPNIVIYGEPWTGGDTTLKTSNQARQSNGNKFVGYGQFNDHMRDALIKGGYDSGSSKKGWATGDSSDVNKIIDGMQGVTNMGTAYIRDMYKTVNYVTCHDNYTLKDRIGKAGITDPATVKQMAMLANSVVLTSNGVSFMLAGEEFLRSKAAGSTGKDDPSNSYDSSYKANELDYALKIENADMVANYQKLIEFKKMFVKDFALTSNEQVKAKFVTERLTGAVAIQVTITAKDGSTWQVVHANGEVGSKITVNLEGYKTFLDTLGENAADSTLGSLTMKPYQTIIAYKAA